MAFLEKGQENLKIKQGLTIMKFNFSSINDEIDINSLTICYFVHFDFYISDSRINIVEDKNKIIFIEFLDEYNYIELLAYKFAYVHDSTPSPIDGFYLPDEINPRNYHKLSILKEEEKQTILFIFFSDDFNYNFHVYNFINNKFIKILSFTIQHDYLEAYYFYSIDMLVFNENKTIIVSQKLSGRQLLISIIDFFDNYTNVLLTKFQINIINLLTSKIFGYFTG